MANMNPAIYNRDKPIVNFIAISSSSSFIFDTIYDANNTERKNMVIIPMTYINDIRFTDIRFDDSNSINLLKYVPNKIDQPIRNTINIWSLFIDID